MRTLDQAFIDAAANGTGIPYLYLVDVNGGSWTAGTYPVIDSYEMTRFKITIWGHSPNILGLESALPTFKLERGLVVDGITYAISSPLYFQSNCFLDYQNNAFRLEGLAYPPNYSAISTSATQTAKQVIEALIPSSCTTSFLDQTWEGYQYDLAGTVKPGQFEILIVQLWNKYTVKIFPRDNGKLLFKTKITAAEETATAVAWQINTSTKTARTYTTKIATYDEITSLPYWNIYWEDGVASHRLSADYPDLVNIPIRNVGFLPVGVSKPYIYELLARPPHSTYQSNNKIEYNLSEFTMRPDFRFEQGDYVEITGQGKGIISITERYNRPGTIYPWEMKIKCEPMGYEGGAL